LVVHLPSWIWILWILSEALSLIPSVKANGIFQAILEKNATAAAQKNINLEILRGLEVPKPPIANQNEFALVVEKIEALKNRYQHSLVDLEALYGAFSQQAFKGQLVL